MGHAQKVNFNLKALLVSLMFFYGCCGLYRSIFAQKLKAFRFLVFLNHDAKLLQRLYGQVDIILAS